MITTLSVFTPTIVSALCIPVLFHHAGYSRLGVGLSLLPVVITTFALLSVLVGERAILDGNLGTWAIAACLLALVFKRRQPTTPSSATVE